MTELELAYSKLNRKGPSNSGVSGNDASNKTLPCNVEG